MNRRHKHVILGVGAAILLLGGMMYLGVSSQKTVVELPAAQVMTAQGRAMSNQATKVQPGRPVALVSLADYRNNQAQYSDDRVIYFFRTDWCFVCNAVAADMRANPNRLPEKTVFVEVDFEKEVELRQKYNVQYQTTFVQVDKNGTQVSQWHAQNVNEVLAGIKA